VQRRELVHQRGQVLLVHAVVQHRDLRAAWFWDSSTNKRMLVRLSARISV
jgi:hypothetical protein